MESFTDIFMMDLMTVMSMMALVCLLDSQKISIKNKQIKLGHVVFFYFLNMVAVLLLPLECLGEVCRRAISHTPLQLLRGGLIGQSAGSLPLANSPTLRMLSKMVKITANIAIMPCTSRLAHSFRQFGHPPC